jgi:hypothetical protein
MTSPDDPAAATIRAARLLSNCRQEADRLAGRIAALDQTMAQALGLLSDIGAATVTSQQAAQPAGKGAVGMTLLSRLQELDLIRQEAEGLAAALQMACGAEGGMSDRDIPLAGLDAALRLGTQRDRLTGSRRPADRAGPEAGADWIDL